jgi:hypothetical protein
MHVQASQWLHAESIPETSCHQFWLELIPLPKSVGTYSSLYTLNGECLPSSTFFSFSLLAHRPKKRLKIWRLSKIEVPMGRWTASPFGPPIYLFPKPWCFLPHFGVIGKPSTNRVAPNWFHNLSTYIG